MGDAEFRARQNLTVQMLADVKTIYDTYSQQVRNATRETTHIEELRATKANLEAERAKLHKSANAYNREFQDRLDSPPPKGLFERIGLRTIQDWVLFLFYTSLACVVLLFMIYSLKKSESKLKTLAMTIAGSIILVFGITSVLLRFI